MQFTPIDRETWSRNEYFEHYFSNIPCTYSMTVRLDITPIWERGQKLYPAMLYYLTRAVNRFDQFKTTILDGVLGTFDGMTPCYTIFHQDTETFSSIWTEYSPEYDVFLASYEKDLKTYGNVHHMMAKPAPPPNLFTVSMLPWTSFEGFTLHLQKGFDYLAPIFTMGKFEETGGRCLLPLAIQVHHGVCDGYHVSRFVETLQKLIREG